MIMIIINELTKILYYKLILVLNFIFILIKVILNIVIK